MARQHYACTVIEYSFALSRWPLVIDTSGQSSVFLRYRDTNYLNALRPKSMEPDVIRKAVMGAIRYVIIIINIMLTPFNCIFRLSVTQCSS